ncbi:DUF6383 domain-containing protein [Parabacteroides gordonii]|uniref:DUF6383 domain-containing protein n=1 Tax=Parabacteroides gordonii TaxID=574930 RepID=UPI000EEDE90F|nr:DUF6383 domain-containing protein [Parabacteroides gordonii]RGP17100.1 hypothetical protein DXB27_06455 [Parabacteroides gordonii]
MNKKFSTLVAVLLAAGAWTTMDAKVVKVETPIDAQSYLVGSGITAEDAGFTNALTYSGTTLTYGALTPDATSSVWTIEYKTSGNAADGFYLKAGSNYVVAANDANTAPILGDESGSNVKVLFTWATDSEKNYFQVKEQVGTNTKVNANTYLKLGATLDCDATAGNATAIDLAVYAADSNVPGFDLNVDDQGKLIFTGDVAAPNFAAPVYFQIDGNYIYVSGSDVKTDMTAAPKAGEAVKASWRWENGKLVSVAAENADAKAKAKYLKVGSVTRSLAYTLVESANATSFAIEGNAITANNSGTPVSLTTPTMYASAVLANTQAKAEVTIAGGSNVVAGKLQILNAPSGYVVISLQEGATTKYLKAGASNTYETDIELTAALTNGDPKEYEKYLWNVSSKTLAGKAYYTFTSLAKNGDKNYVAFEEHLANAVYSKQGITLGNGTQFIGIDGNLGNTPAVFGFYNAFQLAKTQAQLNGIYSPGFEMTVKVSKDGKETIEDIDVFGKTMYPKATNATNIGETTVELWDNNNTQAKGAKLLALDITKTFDSTSPIVGEFVWITPTELSKNGTNYETGFQFIYSLGDPALIEEVKVGGLGSLYIFKASDKYYLTVNKAVDEDTTLPYIKLEGSNIYDVKKLLGQYLSFSYADTKANAVAAGEEYKLGGMLAITENTTVEADFITGTRATLPEAQWAVTAADKDNNKFTLTNRENASKTLTGVQLREVGNKFIMTVEGGNGSANITSDLVTLTTTALNKTTNFDGYMQSTPNALRNVNYYLGQYHAVEGNNHAYFVENHTEKASHQIGMTAEKEKAQKWNLRLATKADEDGKYTLVDTVKVPLVFATLIDGKIVTDAKNKDVVKDTLFILPYAFQNASNRELVSYKEGKGFEFYYCNEDYKENSDVNSDEVIKFALKMKPDNTYNFVELSMDKAHDTDALGAEKVLGGNSANKGVISRVATYDQNANSLMVVEKADAPEYHKIAMAWGDTIKLFRDENNSQVVFEKLDRKSVVEKDTLSFLNIDNVNQFKVNPAIFADTAYINRVDANGELNTCYQYLLAVNVDPEKSYYCPYNPEHNTDEWRKEHNGPCADAKEHRAVYGRFLINLIDTANVYGEEHIHNNPYIDEVEVGADKRAKLSFVEGIHADDTLYVTRQGGEVVKLAMDTPDFNVAKFAFRYVDADAKTFKIQTQFKEYAPETDADDLYVSNEGYLRWINGALVVTEDFENGDVFGIEENYEGNPVANEDITASSISVIAQEGKVVINGAAGKKVTISNVLGQTIANTVLSSDNATIAAPAGIVVVAVEGEAAVKAIVK